MSKIDLNTRFISENHKVFVLHPGKRKRFYEDFAERNAVFLDIPGTQLPQNLDLENVRHRAAIYMGRHIGQWYRNSQSTKNKPSSQISAYLNKVAQQSTIPRYMSEAKALYRTAKPGDLVVVPGSGYMSRVFIGEFTDTFDPAHSVAARIYPADPIPARNVKWIHTRQIKAHFSDRLIKLMQNRQALIEISDIAEKKEIYDLCYKEYNLGDEAQGRIRVTKSHIDLRDMVDANDFVSYFVAMYSAKLRGELPEFMGLDWKAAAEEFYDRDLLTDTSYSINSPGWLKLRSSKFVLPAFVGVLLTLASSGATLDQAKQIEISNSSMVTNNECVLEISQTVRETLEMMNAGEWERICREMKELEKNVGLESTMTLKP
ncbi:hypothetical protein [Kordiimonas gwangyangensis]|uniref:hypothetical protein n=1 Tax=Kordiimonas gwangyangensis TaxID=288022 RepID=UPI0003753623|nr:hypothetical protein [Kordiimonas gwangyangensis]